MRRLVYWTAVSVTHHAIENCDRRLLDVERIGANLATHALEQPALLAIDVGSARRSRQPQRTTLVAGRPWIVPAHGVADDLRRKREPVAAVAFRAQLVSLVFLLAVVERDHCRIFDVRLRTGATNGDGASRKNDAERLGAAAIAEMRGRRWAAHLADADRAAVPDDPLRRRKRLRELLTAHAAIVRQSERLNGSTTNIRSRRSPPISTALQNAEAWCPAADNCPLTRLLFAQEFRFRVGSLDRSGQEEGIEDPSLKRIGAGELLPEC